MPRGAWDEFQADCEEYSCAKQDDCENRTDELTVQMLHKLVDDVLIHIENKSFV